MRSTPTGRRLEALAILQANPGISAARLAERLGVTERTARRDVLHLRDLGYRIDAAPGRYGGYTLAAGTSMPPLVLDADEALAVAVGLRSTAGVGGLGAAAATALAKLTASVPSRLRARLDAMGRTEAVAYEESRPVDPGVLVALALACRSGEAVHFRHRRAGQVESRARDAQPYRVVTVRGRWYLVACERDDDHWRTYALDRIADVRPLGVPLEAPDPPPDAAAFVTERLAHGRLYQVRVRLRIAGDAARAMIAPSVGSIEDDGDDCILTLGTDDLDGAARWLVFRNVDFDVLAPAELSDRLQGLGAWLAERYAAD